MRSGLQLHRSLTFWFGLLMMVFVGWAWRDSLHYTSGAGISPVFVNNMGGGVTLGHNGRTGGLSPRAGRQDLKSAHLNLRYEVFAMPFVVGSRQVSHEERETFAQSFFASDSKYSWREYLHYLVPYASAVFLPHWLILAVGVLLWLALLRCCAGGRGGDGRPAWCRRG